jgi:hypothetical protein
MTLTRLAFRSMRPSMAFNRSFSTTPRRFAGAGNAEEPETSAEHRKIQSEKPLNPHLTSTTSTIASGMPSVGAQNSPPDLLTSIDPNFVPKDSSSENTVRMTGGTQKGAPDASQNPEIGVGELQGAKFKIEPLRRTGEDLNTMRARLLCSPPFQQLFSLKDIADTC